LTVFIPPMAAVTFILGPKILSQILPLFFSAPGLLLIGMFPPLKRFQVRLAVFLGLIPWFLLTLLCFSPPPSAVDTPSTPSVFFLIFEFQSVRRYFSVAPVSPPSSDLARSTSPPPLPFPDAFRVKSPLSICHPNFRVNRLSK